MRKKNEVYWSVSLPKDHEALQALDDYCKEWGGLSRAEATRRLLLEWNKIQRGQPVSVWVSNLPSQSVEPLALQRAPHHTATMSKSSIKNPSAKAASRVLDE